jgi:pyridoxine/pyridoxamine 5'-phosphate oxidase
MIEEVFKSVQNELINGTSKKGHPFRYFTLATIENNIPQQRTVVLRKVNPELELLFYTDRRSNKIQHLLANSNVSALFYHPKKLLQLKMEGTAEIIDDVKIIKSLWNGIPLKSRKDYTTQDAPGSPLKNPDEIDYLTEENHFCIVRIIPKKIEYLRLKRPNHIRAVFKKESTNWNSDFLVP